MNGRKNGEEAESKSNDHLLCLKAMILTKVGSREYMLIMENKLNCVHCNIMLAIFGLDVFDGNGNIWVSITWFICGSMHMEPCTAKIKSACPEALLNMV